MGLKCAVCIYCGERFDPDETKPEHIVLAALGGKKRSRSIVCSECNEKFSSEIDRPLAESLAFARTMIGVPRKVRDQASTEFTGTETGTTYRMRPNGQVEPRHPDVTETPLEDGKGKKLRIRADPRAARRILEEVSRSHERFQIGEIRRTLSREPLEQNFQLTPESRRCIAKMALNLLAVAPGLGSAVALSRAFDEVRQYVRDAASPRDTPVRVRFPGPVGLEEADGGDCFNRVVVHCSSESGRAVAWITLLGALSFSVLLSRQYDGVSGRAVLRNYPLEKGADLITEEEPSQIAPDYMGDLSPAQEWEALRACTAQLLGIAQRHQYDRWLKRSIQDSFEETAPTGITDENAEDFARNLASRIVEGLLPPGTKLEQRYDSIEDLGEE